MSTAGGSLHWVTVAFGVALAGETGVRLWLANRQIAAVRAHRDRVPELFAGRIGIADQQRAADYTVERTRLSRWATLIETALKLALTLGGGLALLGAAIDRGGWPDPWRGAALVLAVFLLLGITGLPFTWWRTFRIEARFGFNRMTPALFVKDAAKRLALGLALGAPLVLVTLLLMEKAGAGWWLWTWIVWMAVSLLLAWAAPRFIAPLFNDFAPLEDGLLRARVEKLLERCGFSARGGVFVMDGSLRSAHGNAYFTGFGRNKRIVFFDTLLARIDGGEIEAVLAHELGHFRLHHVRQRLLISALALFGGLALVGWLAAQPGFYPALGVPRGSPAMALMLFVLVVPAFTFFATPLEAWWSRRHERQADDFAVVHADADRLAGALVKLYRDNASTLTPDPVHSAFFDSHPPALERIARLKRMALERGAAHA